MAALCFLPSALPRPRCFNGHHQYPSGATKHRPVAAPQVSTIADQQQSFPIDKDSLVVAEATDEDQLWAAACLRKKSLGAGAEFARAYLSNVCVAKELHRNGVGYDLVVKSKRVAEEWGITDVYVHVAVDNEAAKKLYMKCGFVYENDEPAWQARFLDRPRRVLLWFGLPSKEL